MAASATAPLLFVEGSDDEHAIGQLLLRHRFAPQKLPEFRDAGGKDGVLRSMRTAIPAGTSRSLGFVLDANNDLDDRWKEVTARLRHAGVDTPDEIPIGGFVGESTAFRTRVGVWLMPDNQRVGALEDFLKELIEEKDPLLPHAVASTSQARTRGALFPDKSSDKAVLHTWLAWQEQPGRPYGMAIKLRYFRDDSETAKRFLTWFSRVFKNSDSTPQPR